ncbi:hypothetical protein NC653_021889 [Populus alba x Populus x berolinensis]|uniref:Uncharacterized protein n=1 Tax=Populus alba x Populus x berolinensis TaxID=444605 RepID=A0AAD6MPM5_9ROSI|nr:hypothetical protein NC653_021889 [Populus alba x Populus x berolinensis]
MLLNLLTLHCYSLEVPILWTSLGVNFNDDRYFGFSKKVPVVALAEKGWVLAFGLGIGMGDCELLRSCKVLVSEFSSLQIGSSFSHGKPTTKGEMGSWCDDVLIVFVLLKFHDCIGRKGSLSLVFEAL